MLKRASGFGSKRESYTSWTPSFGGLLDTSIWEESSPHTHTHPLDDSLKGKYIPSGLGMPQEPPEGVGNCCRVEEHPA